MFCYFGLGFGVEGLGCGVQGLGCGARVLGSANSKHATTNWDLG